MATNIIDPIQGLVDYVLEIKPYHTKVVEVLIEYVHTDCIDVTIDDVLTIHVETNQLPIPVSVTVGEELQISVDMEFSDNIYAYNLENTDALGYDGIPVNAFFGNSMPTIPETPTPPLTPAYDDFWFDTSDPNNGLLHRWNGVYWEISQPAYWYDQSTEQLNYRIWYISGGNLTDTNWLPMDAPNAYGAPGVGYNTQPNVVSHGLGYVSVNGANNTFIISGGNFVHHLINDIPFDGHSSISQVGTWTIDDFSVISTTPSTVSSGTHVPGTGAFLVSSDLSLVLSPGFHIYISNTITNKGWYTVAGISVIGSDTLITVQEPVSGDNIFGQIDALACGILHGAFYDPTSTPNPTTILIPKNNPVDTTVEIISYTTPGPYIVDIDVAPVTFISSNIIDRADTIVTSTSFTEDLNLTWGDVAEWYQYLILSVDVSLDCFVVDGYALNDIQPGENILLLGSVNAGEYVVSVTNPPVYSSSTDTTTVCITTDIPFDVSGGWLEPTGALDIVLAFVDDLGVDISENASGPSLMSGGQIGGWDSDFWDMFGFDENIETIVNLIGN